MSAHSELPSPSIHASVALALLESVKVLDRPEELLIDEDVTVTMPRRLGLSQVVDAEVRRLQQLARRGGRLDLDTWAGLIGLVERRPDAPAVGRRAGSDLAKTVSGWVPTFPLSMTLRLTSRRCIRSGGHLFGEPVFRLNGEAEPLEPKGLVRPRIDLNSDTALINRMFALPEVLLPLLEGFLEGVVHGSKVLTLHRENVLPELPSWLLQKADGSPDTPSNAATADLDEGSGVHQQDVELASPGSPLDPDNGRGRDTSGERPPA
jgi:hypothetical protein